MAQWTAPGISLTTGFTPGESGWGDEYNADMLKLSVLVQLRVLSRTIWPPQDGDSSNSAAVTPGDIYIVPESDSNSMQSSNSAPMHGQIAVFAGPDNAAEWIYYTPLNGFLAYVIDEGAFYRYLNGVWLPFGGDAAAVLYNAGDSGDSNSIETTVAGALDDLYERIRNISAGVVDASTVQYNSGVDSNSTSTTVQEALDLIFGVLIGHTADIADHEGRISALEGASSDEIQFGTINASRRLTAADHKHFFEVDDSSNSTETTIQIGLPTDVVEDVIDGFTASFCQIGDMQVEIVEYDSSNSAESLTIIYPPDMLPRTRGPNSVLTVLKSATANRWYVFGDLEPA